MESSDVVSIEKPPSLPPNYVSLAQLQQQWLQRQKEKKLAEERQQEEKRLAEERQQEEKRMAEERQRKEKMIAEERQRQEKRMAEERQRKEKRMAEERQRKEKRIAEERQLKEKEKLLGTELKERNREIVQWRRVDGIHRNSEELTLGAPVAEVSGKNGNSKKKGARGSGILIGEEKCGTRVQFGDKGFQGKVQIAADAHEDSGDNVGGGGNPRKVRKGTAPMNGKAEGVFMEGNGRLREKTELKSKAFDDKEMISSDPSRRDSKLEENVVGEGGSVKGNGQRKKKIEKGSLAFDDKEMVSGDPSAKTRRDSRFEENVVGEGGSVMVNGWRKKKIGRESQAFGDKEMVSGNLSMETKRDLCSEGSVALRKGNAELLKTGTEEDSSVSVGRKRGEGRSRNGYRRKRGNEVVSEIESGNAENVVEEGLLVGKNETGKVKTEKVSQAFGDKGMVSDNLSTKTGKDLVEESGEGKMSVKKGRFRGKEGKRKSPFLRNGDRDGEVEVAIAVLEVVPESKGKEVALHVDKGSKEVRIPVAENSFDQGKLEVARERRRGERKFKVKADRRGTWGGSRESKMESGSEENVGKDGVLVEGNEGQVEKTEMGSQTNGDADLLASNIERGLSSLSLNESSEGNVALRRKDHGWQRKRFGKPRAATVVWVKKVETSEPSISEN